MHVFCFLNNKCEDIATACLMVEVLMEVGVLLGRDLKPSPPIFHSLHPCISPQLATKPCYCYSLNLTFPYTSTQWWKWAFSFPTSGNSVSCTVKKTLPHAQQAQGIEWVLWINQHPWFKAEASTSFEILVQRDLFQVITMSNMFSNHCALQLVRLEEQYGHYS